MVDTKFAVSVHLMATLAYNKDRLINSDQLAISLKTNPSFIRKLVVMLSSAGLIESFRGKNGGIRLASHPKKISLDQIYDAVSENKIINVPEKSPHKGCPVSCIMGNVLDKISTSVEESTRLVLSKTTLQELLSEIN